MHPEIPGQFRVETRDELLALTHGYDPHGLGIGGTEWRVRDLGDMGDEVGREDAEVLP